MKQGVIIGWGLIITLAALQTAAIAFGLPLPGEIKQSNMGLLFLSAMFLLLGLIFTISYYYPERSFLFRGLLSFSESFPYPHRTKKFAFFFSALSSILGVGAFFQYLGYL